MTGSYRGSGEASYHPELLLGLIVYGYATGVFSEPQAGTGCRTIRCAFRFIAANEHPDHRHDRRVPAALPEADRDAVRHSAGQQGPARWVC